MSTAKKKILVVTSNAKLRELAVFAFDVVARWRVLSATSALECLAKASHEAPDAILIDSRTSAADLTRLAETLHQNPGTRSIPKLLLHAAQDHPRPAHNLHPRLLGVVNESAHPRKLATEVAEVLGWWPPASAESSSQELST